MTQMIKILETLEIAGLVFKKVLANCPKHGDVVHTQVNENPLSCSLCAKEQQEQAQIADAKQQAKERFQSFMQSNGIDLYAKGFNDWQFDVKQQERQETILATLKRYAENFHSGLPNILMIGGTGSGKTMLSNALVREVFIKNYKYSYDVFAESNPSHLVTSSSINIQARATWKHGNHETEQELLDRFASYPLLVIDDLGDNDTAGNIDMANADRNRIARIIGKRYQNHPTVITTNLEQSQVMGFLGSRAWDRLQENLIVIKCDWDSYRKSIAKMVYL